MKKRVLVTYNMFRTGYAELIRKFDVTFPPEGRETFTYDEVYEMIPEYDVLQSMFNFPVDRKLMERGLPRLELVSNYAVGFDNIDIPAATGLGITITNTPGPVTEPTADLAFRPHACCRTPHHRCGPSPAHTGIAGMDFTGQPWLLVRR